MPRSTLHHNVTSNSLWLDTSPRSQTRRERRLTGNGISVFRRGTIHVARNTAGQHRRHTREYTVQLKGHVTNKR
eukprot:5980-Prymnesium_polylepis.1